MSRYYFARVITAWAALALAAHPAAAQAVLKVTRVPADTRVTDTVFVTGSFNGWNPHDLGSRLTRNANGTFQINLPAGLGRAEYKFTRGSWANSEAGANQQPRDNRQADFQATPEVVNEIVAWTKPGAPVVKKHTASARVHVLSKAFEIPQLGRRRRILVYLPADYAKKPAQRYPVLYMHDGQNVFDEATSYSGEWGVDETLDRLPAAGQDPSGCIVVAVDNDNQHRSDEYIPWRNAEIKAGGQGAAYVDFLALTLKPYVDAHYRTRPDVAHTGIAGSSLGGLISVYAALKYPRVFGRVGAFSPAFWVCNDSLQAFAKKHPASPAARFYFLCGPKESDTMLPLMQAWRDELRTQGVPVTNLAFKAPADGQHREWFWQREFPAAYAFLFTSSPATKKPGLKNKTAKR